MREPIHKGKPRALKRFKCHICGELEAVTGGTSRFVCSGCKHHRLNYGPHVSQSILNGRESAVSAVAQAIRTGELSHPSNHLCADCGTQATEYDHRDYNRPLEVDPVCRRCNLNRGPAIPVPNFFTESIKRGAVPYRLKRRVHQLFEVIGIDPAPLAVMPKTLTLEHWQALLPLIEQPTKEPSHA